MSLTIYIADDDHDDQYLMQQALNASQANATICFADNGHELLAQLKPTAQPSQALAFIDLNMPSMGGLECLQSIRRDERLITMPVIIFTTSNNEQDMIECYKSGANIYLSKPAGFSELKFIINRVIEFFTEDREMISEPNHNSIQVALLEDDSDDVYLIEKFLRSDSDAHYKFNHFSDLTSFLPCANDSSIDVMLMDLNLPDSKGLNTLRTINLRTPRYPVIVLTNHSDGEYGRETIHMGADDFLCKADIDSRTLNRAIRYAIERFKLRHELEKRAYTDELTQLPNRTMLLEQLSHMIATATRTGNSLAVAMIDLNRFKLINDQHGHLWGDAVLCHIGKILQKQTRSADMIARFGGDEFICIYSDFDSVASIGETLQRKLEFLHQPLKITLQDEEKRLSVGACAGVATYPKDAETLNDLIKAADEAMYKAKERPDCSVVFYSEI